MRRHSDSIFPARFRTPRIRVTAKRSQARWFDGRKADRWEPISIPPIVFKLL